MFLYKRERLRVIVCLGLCMCKGMCVRAHERDVCVCEREIERERERAPVMFKQITYIIC